MENYFRHVFGHLYHNTIFNGFEYLKNSDTMDNPSETIRFFQLRMLIKDILFFNLLV